MPYASHENEDKLSEHTKELHRAFQSIVEELEAVDWYQARIDATGDEELRPILAHKRDEEKEHASMLLEWVRRNDPAFAKEMASFLFKEGARITEIEEKRS